MNRLTITVPEAGRWLGLSRNSAYQAAARGEIPTLRIGGRLLVPVPKLLALVGASPQTDDEVGAPTPTLATTDEVSGEPRHDQCDTIHRIA